MAAMSGGMPLIRDTGQILRQYALYGRKILESFLNLKRAGRRPNFGNEGELVENALGKPKGRVIIKCEAKTGPTGPGKVALAGKGTAGTTGEGTNTSGWSLAAYLARTTTRTLAAELRRKAALQFSSRTPVIRRAYSRGTPLYSFVGLGFAGNQFFNGQEENDGFQNVCSQIKEMFSGANEKFCKNDCPDKGVQNVGHRLEDYVFGPMIAKGCNSAVYSARLKDPTAQNEVGNWNCQAKYPTPSADFENDHTSTQQEGMKCESLASEVDTNDTADLSEIGASIELIEDPVDSGESFEVLAEGMETDDDVDFDVFDELSSDDDNVEDAVDTQEDYPLAIKMMFNYDAESNASDILRTMESEAVPAHVDTLREQLNIWDNGNRVRKKRLKPHRNVVDMFGVFVDDVPHMPNAMAEYPDALPTRLNPDGSGRNKTLFIVMKRYRMTLREYLADTIPSIHQSSIIFCQLLESVLHINRQGIAHRDLKSDNILLDGDEESPHLVVTDFGCCLAEEQYGLQVPYNTYDTGKGGNGCLMAPEIALAEPGRRQYLDYTKSDLWASGAIMYEIYGGENPFYSRPGRYRLDSRTYKVRDLPDFPPHVPTYIQRLARSILKTKHTRRPDLLTVTNAMHLLLWCPTEWRFSLETRGRPPATLDVVRWLLTLAAGVMCRRAGQNSGTTTSQKVDYALQCQFLARLDLDKTMEAVQLLWSMK